MVRPACAVAGPAKLLLALCVARPAAAFQDQAGDTPPDGPPAARLEVTYTGDVLGTVSGGLRRDVVYLDNTDVTLALDLEATLGWSGATAFVYGIGNQGGEPSGIVGDLQGVDNVEANDSWRVFEAWVEQVVWDRRGSLLAGLYDVNSEFDRLPSADLFVNSSFGLGAELALSRPQGPSTFPVTSLGVRLRTVPHHAVYVQGAVLDGVPGNPSTPLGTAVRFDDNDGVLGLLEIGVMRRGPVAEGATRQRGARRRHVTRLASTSYRMRAAIGAWAYTAWFERLDMSGSQRGNVGLYLLGEWFARPERGDPTQGLWVAARAGIADARVNRIAAYTGIVLVYRGALPERPDDEVGIGVAAAHNGRPYLDRAAETGTPAARTETAIELTYRAALLGGLSMQPGVQLVLAPDTDPSRPAAVVLVLRTQVAM